MRAPWPARGEPEDDEDETEAIIDLAERLGVIDTVPGGDEGLDEMAEMLD